MHRTNELSELAQSNIVMVHQHVTVGIFIVVFASFRRDILPIWCTRSSYLMTSRDNDVCILDIFLNNKSEESRKYVQFKPADADSLIVQLNRINRYIQVFSLRIWFSLFSPSFVFVSCFCFFSYSKCKKPDYKLNVFL